jgi:hypothetical protein
MPGNAEGRPADGNSTSRAGDEEYIRQLVAEAPPLTEDQRSRIAALLHGGDPA